jgi:glycosyltransferase involved in cell wall biosynthesis
VKACGLKAYPEGVEVSPAVSVIIPAYNSAGTIARALDSVLAQSYRDFEIIVVDDGSRDDLESALTAYSSRITLVRQPNSGASAARNAGARMARGELLAFLDADDFWHERKLELQVQAFERRPEIVLCWTQEVHWFPGEACPEMAIPHGTSVEPIFSSCFEEIFANPYLGTPGVVMPKRIFLQLGGFREDLRCAEDVDLWLRAASLGDTALIPWPLFCVVVSPNSLTATQPEGTYRDNLRVIDDFCSEHPDFARLHRVLVRRVKSRVYENWGSSLLVDNQPRRAMTVLWRSLRQLPSARAAYLLAKACVGSARS